MSFHWPATKAGTPRRGGAGNAAHRHGHACHVLGCALLAVSVALVGLSLNGCSTAKNTAGSRFYHKVTAHFNTFYNGSEAYKEGCLAQETGNKDDYTRMIPLFPVGNKATASQGKGNFETAVTKCEKAIKQHSIKKKPVFAEGHKKTPRDREFLARREYNPFLKNAWLLMGQAQFHKGDFIEAASTFNYVIRLYATQPEVSSMARAWLARCYVEQGWLYDAEDVFNKLGRDSMTTASQRERDATYADYLIHQKRFEEAIPYVIGVSKHEKRKKQRAREYFLLGQLYQSTGRNGFAYKYLSKVIRTNPPYELEFNARILQTEVMAKGQGKSMIGKLKHMAHDQRNVDYQDQIFYAIGNIYLAQRDTGRAIGNYEMGVKKATRSGIEKGVLLLRLGQVYWNMEDYIDAARCYSQATAIISKEYEEYEETKRRADILAELEPPLSSVKLQDSLQVLAKLPEAERNKAIDRVIEALKKKEKEEAKNAPDNANQNGQTTGNMNNRTNNNANKNAATNTSTRDGAWYFYNPMIVSQGKSEFQRRWGTRSNVDNWRISNKASLKGDATGEAASDSTGTGSAASDSTGMSDEEKALADSLANDPHHREFYLKQIPMTADQLKESNATLCEALYTAAVVEKDKLENLPLADRTFKRLITNFPDFDKKADLFYNLFLLKYRMGDAGGADRYRQLLVDSFPKHKYTLLVNDPNYELNARYGKHIEDSIYADTYDNFMAAKYGEVASRVAYSEKYYPEGLNRAKFIFLGAMSQLQTGDQKGFLKGMKELTEKYSKEGVGELAASFVKGIESGRTLLSGALDASGIWARHSVMEGDSTGTSKDTLSPDPDCPFEFVIAYPQDSVNENQLLYNLAHYNFTSFLVRNFDISVTKGGGIARMEVKGFLSYDEAHAYAQQLFRDTLMARMLRPLRIIIISEANLKLLGVSVSYDEYKTFYDKHFAPLVIPKDLILDNPTEVVTQPEEETQPEENDDNSTEEKDDSGGYYDGY
jgi:tetratricopeptide (TPR) repeat protein